MYFSIGHICSFFILNYDKYFDAFCYISIAEKKLKKKITKQAKNSNKTKKIRLIFNKTYFQHFKYTTDALLITVNMV